LADGKRSYDAAQDFFHQRLQCSNNGQPELMKKNDSSDVVRKVQPSEGVLLDPSLPLDQLIAW
jgi:hypothetical protein